MIPKPIHELLVLVLYVLVNTHIYVTYIIFLLGQCLEMLRAQSCL